MNKIANKLPGKLIVNDGTIDFYLRVRTVIDKSKIVLDLGAGSGNWFNDKQAKVMTKTIQFLKNDPAIDQIIILDRNNKIKNGRHDGIVGSYNLVKDLKKFNFDKIFIFNSSLRFNLIARTASIKDIYQYPLFKKKKSTYN